MKKIFWVILPLFLLSGCTKNTNTIESIKENAIPDSEKTEIIKEVENPSEMEDLKELCEKEIKKDSQNLKFSIYVKNLNSEEEMEISSQKMQAASLIKLYIAGAIFEKEEELLKQCSKEELYPLLQNMICVSDNSAANQLVSLLGNGDTDQGKRVVNEYCLKHQFTNTHMGRLLLESNAKDDNYTSVKDCGHFLDKVYHEKIPGSKKILEYLLKQERRSKIPQGIPSSVKVGNKTGELDTVENDAAIVFLEKNPYILCIQSENLGNPSQARETIVSLSSLVYQYMDDQ